jgi:hypothetical protein
MCALANPLRAFAVGLGLAVEHAIGRDSSCSTEQRLLTGAEREFEGERLIDGSSR